MGGGGETARPSRLAPSPCHDFERESGLSSVGLRMRRMMRGLRLSLGYVSLLSSICLSLFLHFDLRSHCRARQPSSARRSRSGTSTQRHPRASCPKSINPAIPSPSLFHPPPCLGLWEEGGACAAAFSQSLGGGGRRRRCLVSAFADQGTA